MKKKLFIGILLIAMCANVLVNFNSQEKAISKNLVLSNVEALAWNEPEPEGGAPYSCFRDCRPRQGWSEQYTNIKDCMDCQYVRTNYWKAESYCVH